MSQRGRRLLSYVALVALLFGATRSQRTLSETLGPMTVRAERQGDVVTGREWSVRVLRAESGRKLAAPTSLGDPVEYRQFTTPGHWIVVEVELTGIDGPSLAPDAAVMDNEGRSWRMSDRLSEALPSLIVGVPTRMGYAFEVPASVVPDRVVIHPDAVRDSAAEIPLRLPGHGKDYVYVPQVEVGK